MTASDVEKWSSEDIQYAINEMYARHGVVFTDAKFRLTFKDFSWYTPQPQLTSKQAEETFTPLEAHNVELLGYFRTARRNSGAPSPTASPELAGTVTKEQEDTAIKSLVEASTRASSAADVNFLVSQYADQVDFLDEGSKTRDEMRAELVDYFTRWPVQKIKLTTNILIKPLNVLDRELRFGLHFEASNPQNGKRSQGDEDVNWIVRREPSTTAFQIISQKQARKAETKQRSSPGARNASRTQPVPKPRNVSSPAPSKSPARVPWSNQRPGRP